MEINKIKNKHYKQRSMTEWLGEILSWFTRPKTVTRRSISRGDRESNSRLSIRESNTLTTRLPSHLLLRISCHVVDQSISCVCACVCGALVVNAGRRAAHNAVDVRRKSRERCVRVDRK